MGARGPLLVGRAVTDDGAASDHGGCIRPPRLFDGCRDGVRIMAVDRLHVPARGREARHLVVGHGQVRAAVDGNTVVVPQHDELAQLQVPGHGNGFVADAFHQAAVTGDDICMVIDQGVAEARVMQPFRQRHADGGGDTLPERPGRRLDPRRVAVFGMARGLGAQLAEVLQFAHGHARIAGQMQQAIEQHRPVARRQHEAVTIRPFWVRRIELQEPGEQHRRRIGHAHGHARMAGIGPLHGIGGKESDGIRHVLMGYGRGGRRLRGHARTVVWSRHGSLLKRTSPPPDEPGNLAGFQDRTAAA